MFKKLGMIGLAIAITLLVASQALADVKFYGGEMIGNILIRPTQDLKVDNTSAVGTQGLTAGDTMMITTRGMYGIVADNQFLTRDVRGTLGKSIFERQATAAHNTKGTRCTYYKSSGLQTAVGNFGVTSFDEIALNGNDGNIQFDAQGANPTLRFNEVSQTTTDIGTVAAPRFNQAKMGQVNNVTATLASVGADSATPVSLLTTGNAAGLVTIGSGITLNTRQDQEFSSLISQCQGLYKGDMTKIDSIDMRSVTRMGTGSVVIR